MSARAPDRSRSRSRDSSRDRHETRAPPQAHGPVTAEELANLRELLLNVSQRAYANHPPADGPIEDLTTIIEQACQALRLVTECPCCSALSAPDFHLWLSTPRVVPRGEYLPMRGNIICLAMSEYERQNRSRDP